MDLWFPLRIIGSVCQQISRVLVGWIEIQPDTSIIKKVKLRGWLVVVVDALDSQNLV